jgi:hypothetical protein
MDLRIDVVDGSHCARAAILCIGKSDTHDENSSLVWASDVFYRLSRSTRTMRFGGIMSIYRVSGQHSDSSTQSSKASSAAHGLTINPLWMVTFAAGLLFGMLVVLLTSG